MVFKLRQVQQNEQKLQSDLSQLAAQHLLAEKRADSLETGLKRIKAENQNLKREMEMYESRAAASLLAEKKRSEAEAKKAAGVEEQLREEISVLQRNISTDRIKHQEDLSKAQEKADAEQTRIQASLSFSEKRNSEIEQRCAVQADKLNRLTRAEAELKEWKEEFKKHLNDERAAVQRAKESHVFEITKIKNLAFEREQKLANLRGRIAGLINTMQLSESEVTKLKAENRRKDKRS